MLEIRHEHMTSTADTQAVYDRLYREYGILCGDSLYLWLISLLAPQPDRLLLDISCGQGRLVALAQRQGLRAIGVDFAMEGIRLGYADSPDSGWGVADGECLPLADASVDYVTHIGSLEHYIDPQCGASEIGRVLKPGGRACVLLPNAYGLFGNISYVCATGEIFDDGQPLQRYATRRTWEAILRKGGLRPERVIRYEVELPRTWRDAAWLIRHPFKLLRAWLTPLLPINLTSHFVFICSRSPEAA
jgi:SAM-dependent methyltransferase